MKRLLPILLYVLSASACQGLQGSDKLLSCFTEGKPMDSSFYWDGLQKAVVEDSNESDNVLTARSCWTLDSLYFRFDVTDSDLRAYQTEKDHKELYLDDMVEFLLDSRLDRTEKWDVDDIIYHINILGQKKDDRGTCNGMSDSTWDGNARYLVDVRGTINDESDVDEGYSITVAVPWSEVGRIPAHGLEMGLNFAFGDNDGNGRQMVKWRETDVMRTPSCFGKIIMTKK